MRNKKIKNIFIAALALFGIMLASTLIVISFNYLIGFSTDVNTNDVATSIAAVAFSIAIAWRYLYDKNQI
jgi:membrane protein CcdC involved in cytochrome C biogenesis